MTSIAATSCYWTRERHFLEKLIPCKKILLVNGNVHQECGEYRENFVKILKVKKKSFWECMLIMGVLYDLYIFSGKKATPGQLNHFEKQKKKHGPYNYGFMPFKLRRIST